MMIIGDISSVIANPKEDHSDENIIPLESLPDQANAMRVLRGKSNSELLDQNTEDVDSSFIDEDTVLSTNYKDMIVDSGVGINSYDPQFGSKLVISKDQKTYLRNNPNLIGVNKSKSVSKYYVSGILNQMIHTVNQTGHGSLPFSESYVSFVEYRTENGQLMDPIFDKLPKSGGKYWLNRMVTIGNLGQKSGSTKLHNSVDSMTYGESSSTGEKLVKGSTYWETNSNGVQKSYSTITSNGQYSLTDGTNYLSSFTLQGRDSQWVDIKITTTKDTSIDLYSQSSTPITAYSIVRVGSYKFWYYQFFLGTTPTSYLIKTKAVKTFDGYITICHEWQSNPFDDSQPPLCVDQETIATYIQPELTIELTNFNGYTGYYEQVDGVEEFKIDRFYTSSTNPDYITTMVLGDGFQPDTSNERMDAQVPPSARTSMQQAASTNPTKDRVFDVSLLLEKIVADFSTLKGDVQSKIYEMLSVSIALGGKKFADWIWRILEEYGFGSIERIINFFSTEDNQNRLANVILGDNDQTANNLQCQLNLNTPFTNSQQCYDDQAGLNYLAVAKVGILVFAQYIHDTFIATGGWQESAWNGLMNIIGHAGWTLVDVVNQIWSVTASAMTIIQQAAISVMNAVKSGITYLANSVKSAVLDGLVMGLTSMFEGFAFILNVYSDQISVTSQNNVITISTPNFDTTIEIRKISDAIEIELGDQVFGFSLFNEIETLSLTREDAISDLNYLFGTYLWSLISLTSSFILNKGKDPISQIGWAVSMMSSVFAQSAILVSFAQIISNIVSMNEANEYSKIVYDYVLTEYAALGTTTMLLFTPTILKSLGGLLSGLSSASGLTSVIVESTKLIAGSGAAAYGLAGYYFFPAIVKNHGGDLYSNEPNLVYKLITTFIANSVMVTTGIALNFITIVRMLSLINTILHFFTGFMFQQQFGYVPNTSWS